MFEATLDFLAMSFATTYQYEPLESDRHIRLLKIEGLGLEKLLWKSKLMPRIPKRSKARGFSILHASIDDDVKYEAVSYAWGNSTRVAKLAIAKGQGHIALTQSLVNALPYLVKQSRTGLLWIDQICINQDDVKERGHQVILMGDVFRNSTRTLIWLGLDDESGRRASKVISDIKRSKFTEPGEYGYEKVLKLRELCKQPNFCFNSSEYYDVAASFTQCHWMLRGWIVQEYLLSKSPILLWGNYAFLAGHLDDLYQIFLSENLTRKNNRYPNFGLLVRRKDFFDNLQKSVHFLDWLRIVNGISGIFETTIERDGLFAFLGLWKPTNFQPSYIAPLEEVYTDFARCVAKETGSLDFLSINQDRGADNELSVWGTSVGLLPRWVPIWSELGLREPDSLAQDLYDRPKPFNAANYRLHEYVGTQTPGHLKVMGKIIDRINFKCTDKFTYKLEVEMLSDLETAAHELAEFSRKGVWTTKALVGVVQRCDVLAYKKVESDKAMLEVLKNLSFQRTLNKRSFILTESGKVGMVPWWCQKGHLVAVIHGCSVPLILSKIENGSTYNLIGDCYLEGVMHGEAVTWTVDEADELVLS